MKPATINNEILDVAKRYLKPRLVNVLVRDLKRVEAFERKLTGARPDKREKHQTNALRQREQLDHLFTICQTNLKERESFQVMISVGDVFRTHGELGRAEEIYTMALAHGEAVEDSGMVGEAYMRRGDVFCRLGRWRESSADLDKSRKIYRQLNDHVAVGKIDNILGTNYAVQGRLKQAQLHFQRALASFERFEETLMTGTVLMNMGIVNNIVGQYDEALRQYRRARPYFEEVGDLQKLADLHHNMGMSYLFKREYKKAIGEFDQCINICTKSRYVNVLGLAALGKANAYYRAGDLRMALSCVNQALEYFTVSNDRLSIADSYKLKGMIHRELKKYDYAASFLQTSLRINLELQNQLNTAETYFEIGLLEKKRRDRQKSMAALKNAHALFTKVGAKDEVKRVADEIKFAEGKTRRAA